VLLTTSEDANCEWRQVQVKHRLALYFYSIHTPSINCTRHAQFILV